MTAAAPRTRWGHVGLLLAVGVACALQVGKVPPALVELRRSLDMSLVQVAWVLSLLSALAAVGGCLAGSLSARWGARRVVLGSVVVMAVASVAGALSPTPAGLLASRAVEGAGFLFAVVAVPSLLAASSAPADREVVSGFWGGYMGVGMAAAMFAAPALLAAGGWRGLWLADGALLAALAVALWWARPPAPPPVAQALSLSTFKAAVRQPGTVLLALLFGAHAYQYMAVFGFLPTVLHDAGMDAERAARWTAAAVLANAGGNALTGWLMKRGMRGSTLLMVGAVLVGLLELGIFAGALAPAARVGCAVLFALVGGITPSTIFVRLRRSAQEPAAAAIAMGLVVQGSHLGQMVSPVLLAALAASVGGWQASPVLLLPMAALIFFGGWRLRRGEAA